MSGKMNSLNSRDKINLIDLFKVINDDDILHIASAIAKSSVHISSRKDAEDVILCMASSIESVFGKRSLKKEYLLKYLWGNGVDVKTSDERTVLVHEVLNFWSNGIQSDSSEQNDSNMSLSLCDNSNSLCSRVGNICEGDTLDRAKEFVHWFWQMFNNTSTDFGPQHFWNDSKLQIRVVDPQKDSTEECTGCESCASRFVSLRCGGYFVNPNMDIPCANNSLCSHCGICAHKDSFGVLNICNRGTLYLNEQLTGKYEIMFSLVRDVSIGDANIFKIKNCYFHIMTNLPLLLSLHNE